MNFYPHFLGDYARDTTHLSMLEHGAYRLMLDAYYSAAKPLPTDKSSLYRMCRAISASERKAVDRVADEFFPINGDGSRHNHRADREIAKANAYADAQSKRAHKRWDKPADMPAHVPEPSRNDANHNHNHNHNKEKSKASSGRPDLTAGFVRFWNAWPKGERKQGKAKCFAIWKRKGLEGKSDFIVAHVEKMARSESWKTGFDPMPETYLNGDRWDGADLDTPTIGEKHWTETWSGIVEKGKSLGIVQREGEPAPEFKLRVLDAAGQKEAA